MRVWFDRVTASDREHQGRGIATEGLGLLIEHVFEQEPEVDAVWTEPIEENAASRALYSRCGLRPAPRPDDLPPGPSYWERRRPTATAA